MRDNTQSYIKRKTAVTPCGARLRRPHRHVIRLGFEPKTHSLEGRSLTRGDLGCNVLCLNRLQSRPSQGLAVPCEFFAIFSLWRDAAAENTDAITRSLLDLSSSHRETHSGDGRDSANIMKKTSSSDMYGIYSRNSQRIRITDGIATGQ